MDQIEILPDIWLFGTGYKFAGGLAAGAWIQHDWNQPLKSLHIYIVI